MTYLEKLITLNKNTLHQANLLFAAKHLLEEEEEKPENSDSKIRLIINQVNKLIFEYNEALNASKNLLSYINLNHINLKANF